MNCRLDTLILSAITNISLYILTLRVKKKREREKIGENFKMRPKIELRKILLCCLGESEREMLLTELPKSIASP